MAIKIARVQTDDRMINQLQQNIASKVEPIFDNLSGKFLTVLSGCTTQPTAYIYWQRDTSTGPVTIVFPTLTGTSNSTTATLSGLPPNLWPLAQQTVFTRNYDNGTLQMALAVIGTDGSISLTKSVNTSAFTSSGQKGIVTCNATYMVANV